MAKIKEYYQVGNREEMTQESLLVLMEDMYKDLALAINSNTSESGNIAASGRLNGPGGFIGTPYNLATSVHPTLGQYHVTFTNPMSSSAYAVVVSPQSNPGSGFKYIATIIAQTTTGFTVQVWDDGGNWVTPTSVNVIVVGDIT